MLWGTPERLCSPCRKWNPQPLSLRHVHFVRHRPQSQISQVSATAWSCSTGYRPKNCSPIRSGPCAGSASPPVAVRALHRVFFKRSPTTEVQVDSIITAVRSTQEGVPPKLVMASRCALPANGLEGDGQFRVFPAAGPSRFNWR